MAQIYQNIDWQFPKMADMDFLKISIYLSLRREFRIGFNWNAIEKWVPNGNWVLMTNIK